MSSSSSAPAEGVRVHWEELPPELRAAFEQRLGASVVEAVTQRGGFSPGLASRLLLSDGRRVFLKAVSEAVNPDSHHIHRREARIVAALPSSAPVPRFLWSRDEGGWVALCFEDVDGRPPAEPWTEGDLGLVVHALREMSSALTPSPIAIDETAGDALARGINGWQTAIDRGEDRLDRWCTGNLSRLADLESRARDAAAGETLLHFDLRADNLLIAGARVFVVDWPWARIGAPFIDWVAMAPSVAMQGGPAPEDFIRRFDVRRVPAHDLNAVLCSLAGFFVVHAFDPPPPGLPTVRAFQAAQGVVALRWLQERTGWR